MKGQIQIRTVETLPDVSCAKAETIPYWLTLWLMN